MPNPRMPLLALAISTSSTLVAQVPQPHWQVDRTLGNAAEFSSPETGAVGRWFGENELGPAKSMGVPYFLSRPLFVTPSKDFSVNFTGRVRPGRKSRYRILASDNVRLTQRSEVNAPCGSPFDGEDITISAHLLDGRAGVIVGYFWVYAGEEIVGYQEVGYRIYPAGTEGTAASGYAETLMALRHLQKWDQGFSNW